MKKHTQNKDLDPVGVRGFKSHPPHFSRTLGSFSQTLGTFLSYLLSRKALRFSTVERKVKALKSLMVHVSDLADVDGVVRFLNSVGWSEGSKNIVLSAYKDYLRMLGFEDVELPRFRCSQRLPFIPTPDEVKALIYGVRSRRLRAFLMVLRDTAARPIEAWRLKWTDLDVQNCCLTFEAAKYSNSRRLKISRETLNMLLSLPHTSLYIFSPSGKPERFEAELEHFTRNFEKTRKRLAAWLNNPRLNKISFKTFRHWKATIEYVKTKDILHVKELLGHVNIQNTLKYVHLAKTIMNEHEFDVVFCQDKETLQAKLAEGYEYVAKTKWGYCLRKPKTDF